MKREACKEPDGWLCVTPESMVLHYDDYKYFMDHFGSIIVGQSNFTAVSRVCPPEDWLSTSGEAFAFMMMRNYYESAVGEVRGGRNRRGRFICKARWANKGPGKNWINNEGLACYEDLYDRVLEARRDDSRRRHACKYWQSRMECKTGRSFGVPEKEAVKRPIRCEAEVMDF